MTSSRRITSTVVWSVWFAMLVAAIWYVGYFGSPIPFLDDLSLVDAVEFEDQGLLTLLWTQHNEHRIPLPRAIQWPLYAVTQDVRSGSFVSIAALGATSAAMIAIARKLRGHSSLTDVFFPLLWLSTGNYENLLMGFQLSLMVPTAFVCAIVFVALRDAEKVRTRTALLCSACLVGLPLCGGPGMLQAPPLGLWLGLVGLSRLRSADPDARRAGRILIVGVVATVLVMVAYMIDFEFPAGSERARSVSRLLGVAVRVQALSIGQAAEPWWPASGVFVVLVPASAALLALHAWRTRPDERWRSVAVSIALATSAVLALGIGFGRASDTGTPGFANRYVGLTAPILATSYFAWLLYGKALTATIVQALLCLVLLLANALVNVSAGNDYGRYRREIAESFEREVRNGVSLIYLAKLYAPHFDPEVERFTSQLERMARLEMPPFDHYPASARARIAWPMIEIGLITLHGRREAVRRRIDGEHVMLLPSGTAVVCAVTSSAQRITGVYGAPDERWRDGSCAPIHLQIVAVDDLGTRTTIWARTLDPKNVDQDRGMQRFDVSFPVQRLKHLEIRPLTVDVGDLRCDYLWLRDVKFE